MRVNEGWKMVNSRLQPIATLRETAPNELLHLVTCNCKTGCNRNCECKRSALQCTAMCGYCAGHGCENRIVPEVSSSDDDCYGESSVSTDTDNEENISQPKEKRPRL